MRKGVVDSFEDNGELVVIELEDKTTIAVPRISSYVKCM